MAKKNDLVRSVCGLGAIAANVPVLCMLYGSMMGDYDGLYLPMYEGRQARQDHPGRQRCP